MKQLGLYICLIGGMFFFSCKVTDVIPGLKSELADAVQVKDWTVRMNYANPLRMSPICLSSPYDLSLKHDSVFCFLPYYGVAHTAPIYPTEGGIHFSTIYTDYHSRLNKKSDGWIIEFKVASTYNTYQFRVELFDNGSTNCQVIMTDKDAISYQGELVRRRQH